MPLVLPLCSGSHLLATSKDLLYWSPPLFFFHVVHLPPFTSFLPLACIHTQNFHVLKQTTRKIIILPLLFLALLLSPSVSTSTEIQLPFSPRQQNCPEYLYVQIQWTFDFFWHLVQVTPSFSEAPHSLSFHDTTFLIFLLFLLSLICGFFFFFKPPLVH